MLLQQPVLSLERDDLQPRHHLEMTQIAGCHTVAKLECRDANEEIGEGETNSFRSVLAVDLSGPESERNGDWVNGQDCHEFVNELPPFERPFR